LANVALAEKICKRALRPRPPGLHLTPCPQSYPVEPAKPEIDRPRSGCKIKMAFRLRGNDGD
jgi:hypothetical protein